jgi:MFS family permease
MILSLSYTTIIKAKNFTSLYDPDTLFFRIITGRYFMINRKKLLFFSGLGGVLEFYDFIIYALMASYLSHAFFPLKNSTTSLLITFATFAVGYFARPIGGVFFGHFGDRHGRKKTFSFSILMMAIATFSIGLIPSYSHIGIMAPILLLLLRIIQGLSVGGEIPGAIAYVSESLPSTKGVACGIIFFCLINGIVLGSLVHAATASLLTQHQMQNWGWRLPFIIGGLLGIAGFFLRQQLKESPTFLALQHNTEKLPLITTLKTQGINALAGVFIVGLGASVIMLFFLFTPTYLKKILHINSTRYLWLKTLALFISAALAIVFGALHDKVKGKKCIFTFILLAACSAYPVFYIYSHHFTDYPLALMISTLINGMAWGVIPPYLAKLFPTNIRYSGVALSYNLGFATIGSLTPLFSILLIHHTGTTIAPMIYLLITASLALIALTFQTWLQKKSTKI